VRLNVVDNHGGLPCESTYRSLSEDDDDDELEEFLMY